MISPETSGAPKPPLTNAQNAVAEMRVQPVHREGATNRATVPGLLLRQPEATSHDAWVQGHSAELAFKMHLREPH